MVMAATFCQAQTKNVEQAFVIKDKELIPEGIAYDPITKTFFVGSIQQNKIIAITPAGTVTDFVTTGQDGLLQVLGMRVDSEGKLWACNNSAEHDTVNKISQIHVFDTKTRKLVRKFILKDGQKHLFNDLIQLKNGDTYITDSDGGAVYVIRKGSDKLETFLPMKSVIYPNGITATPDESKLIVSTGSGLGIVTVDLASKKIEPITHSKFFIIGMDGLYLFKNKLIGVQNVTFPEAVIELSLDDTNQKFTAVKNLISDDPMFDSPTTGVIAGDHFYFIANSQLTQINGMKGKFKNPGTLKSPIIMKIKLN
jgi:DNA-binding beta-propeller fold protein YncE